MVYLAIFILLLVGAAWAGHSKGVGDGVRQERARVAASASAEAAKNPPPELACPERDSDDYKKAITDQPIVTITEPPTGRVVVIRKAVVVIVNATVTGDLVVCGNDAAVVLQVPLADSARVYIAGGQDIKPGTGPAMFLVDDVKAPDEERVWFSNHKPQLIRCYASTSPAPDRPRACGSYYSSAVAPPTPSPSLSKRR